MSQFRFPTGHRKTAIIGTCEKPHGMYFLPIEYVENKKYHRLFLSGLMHSLITSSGGRSIGMYVYWFIYLILTILWSQYLFIVTTFYNSYNSLNPIMTFYSPNNSISFEWSFCEEFRSDAAHSGDASNLEYLPDTVASAARDIYVWFSCSALGYSI